MPDSKGHTSALETARALHRAGDNARALTAISAILEPGAVDAAAWDLKGDILMALARTTDAVEAYNRAVQLQPSHPTYQHDLGRSLLAAGQYVTAEQVLTEAARLKTDGWDVWCDLATAQMRQNALPEALATLGRALELKPDASIAHFNRGTALNDLNRIDEAESAFRKAIQYNAHFLSPMVSLISILGDSGRMDEAEQWFLTARQIAPRDPQAYQAYALALLRHGRLRDGFAGYTWRFQASPHSLQPRQFPYPMWQGESLVNRKLLIWTEQGLGDEILSAGMFPDILATVQSCVIECSSRAAPLFLRSFPNAAVVERRDPPDPATQQTFDFQSPSLSLGAFLRPDFSAFPHRKAYLRADPDLTARLRRAYRARDPHAPVIGIAWDSAARHGTHKRIPLAQWAPLLKQAPATFVSLQYGVKASNAEITALHPGSNLFVDDAIDALESLEASAAQIAAMDLVITVSNTTAHLAGALGVPVWTLLPKGAGCFWYWFRDRADSPWYPSMRLFRQTQAGAWGPVLAEVAGALATAVVEFKPESRL